MANITGRQSLNRVQVLEVDGDPAINGGTPAPVGSIAIDLNGGLWYKFDTSDGYWSAIPSVPSSSRLAGQQLVATDGYSGVEWADPANSKRTVSLYDDFLNYQSGGYWDELIAGAGASINNTSSTNLNASGILELATGTTSSGLISLDTYNTGAGSLSQYDSLVFETRVRFPDLSTGSEEYIFIAGMSGLNDSALFSYRRTVSTGWVMSAAKDVVDTDGYFGPTVAADTWYNLRLVYSAITDSIDYFVNGSFVGNISTNVPSASGDNIGGPQIQLIKTAGTTSRSVYIDYISFYGYLSSDR